MAGYITTQQYLDRYGDRETTLITNETPVTQGNSGTYDSAKVETAIDDASELIDSYISTRYTLPLADVPRVVEGWAAALARELLYKDFPTPEVIRNADLARAQLKDVANNKLGLPVAEGDTPPEIIGGGLAQTSGDGDYPTVTGYDMARYMAPVMGGRYPRACWKRGS